MAAGTEARSYHDWTRPPHDGHRVMILPIHRLVRARMAEAVARLYDIPAGRSGARRHPRRARAAPRARRSRRAARLRAGAPAAQGAARDRAGDRRRARYDRRVLAHRGRAERLRQFLPRSPGLRSGVAVAAPAPAVVDRGQGDRRAHGHQSEQGGAHRPPAQRRARRRVRPAAPLPRPRGRDPELHRRHRRPGRGRRRRVPRARAQDARRGARASPTSHASTTTAGTSTRASPSGTRRTRSG